MHVSAFRFVRNPPIPSRIYLQAVCIRRAVWPCLRGYSQAASPVPPPYPTETTSRSSGLNHQLHPTGRPPLNPKAASASADIPQPSKVDDAKVTGEYRAPLRTVSTSTPISVRDSVEVVYEGPLRKTVRVLKAFSISSLFLSATISPFILTIDANIPMAGRVSMVTVGTCFTYHFTNKRSVRCKSSFNCLNTVLYDTICCEGNVYVSLASI
jgi:hypothetical protein